MTDTEFIENVTFDEISLGQSARLLRTLTLQDIQAFAAVSGDTNPSHLDSDFANESPLHGVVAHGMWGGALISGLLGNQFPGAGTVYLDQMLHFVKPVHVGDTLVVTATVTRLVAEQKRVEFDCTVVNQRGELVLRGMAGVRAPTEKLRTPKVAAPRIQLFDPEARFKELLAKGDGLEPVRCAVVHPCDKESLSGALDAARYGLIVPVLIGPEQRIRHVAQENGFEIGRAHV